MTEQKTYWVRNLAGARALIPVDDSDRWRQHGWTPALAPIDQDQVWMRHPEIEQPALIPWGARAYWQGIGWESSAPPEPLDPTRDPALVSVREAPPDGSVTAVTDWVGVDRGRAETALTAELGRDKPRTTLVDALNRVGQPPAEDTTVEDTAAPAVPNKEG